MTGQSSLKCIKKQVVFESKNHECLHMSMAEVRKLAGFDTQEKAAIELGCEQATISRVENEPIGCHLKAAYKLLVGYQEKIDLMSIDQGRRDILAIVADNVPSEQVLVIRNGYIPAGDLLATKASA